LLILPALDDDRTSSPPLAEAPVLLSMTGFGESRLQTGRLAVVVEVRSVNNRHLKLVAKLSEPYSSLEPEIERLVREVARRGSIQFSMRIERPKRDDDYQLNAVALRSYCHQVFEVLGDRSSPVLAGVLALPGVFERKIVDDDPHEDWPVLEGVARQALGRLQESRAQEGRAMADELLELGRGVADLLEQIARRAPTVVEAYRDRLHDRVAGLIHDRGATIEPKDLIREVAILAERADIAEEITRLRAHLEQYAQVIVEPESAGRKLEFLVQEMGRETNTIGSKANDVEISRGVVEIKGLLERVRELIQNVE
jgi:uncharacterized protein (TIGR00255 family)